MRIELKFFPFTFFLALFVVSCTTVPQAELKQPLPISEAAHPAPMMFSKLKMEIPTGSDVGTISDFGFGRNSWFVISANRRMLQSAISKKDLNTAFSMALEGQGYDVADYLDPIFEEEQENELLRAEYRIGGKIIDAKMNIDHDGFKRVANFMYGTAGESGELYIKIKWSVYDALTRSTVYQTTTEGTGKLRQVDPEGMRLLLTSAFEMAAHNLGTDEAFHDLLVQKIKPTDWRKPKKQDNRPLQYDSQENVSLPALPLSNIPLPRHIKRTKKAAVLVQGGAGHGSGFFITNEGHILTNQHVVGDAQRVRIVTSGKTEKLIAQVLRVSKPRDVALLKLEKIPESLNITTLPIQTKWPAISEDIYAIGAPKNTRLQDTVSKGIVSAHRSAYKVIGTRMDFIQGDVPIHGGNSGGPLLDANGNIVGVSVIGLFMHEGKRSADLNLFIPIEDALKKLDINFANKQGQPLSLSQK